MRKLTTRATDNSPETTEQINARAAALRKQTEAMLATKFTR